MVLMIIFGAGAPYDSVDAASVSAVRSNPQFWPPLAKSLFDDRTNFNEAIRTYDDFHEQLLRLRRASRRPDFDVEKELAALRAEGEIYPPARVQLSAIQFYIRRIIRECGNAWLTMSYGVTNYVELLGRVERWRHSSNEKVTLVTFNYDLILEDALRRPPIGLSFQEMPQYIASDAYKLIKPHGSVKWGQLTHQKVRMQSIAEIERMMIKHVDEFQPYPDEYLVTDSVLISPPDVAPDYTGLAIPAIAIPVMEKSTLSCPESHLKVLDVATSQLLPKVLIIGWRAGEQHFIDRFIRDKLRHTSFQVVAKDLTEAQATKAVLVDRLGIDPGTVACSSASGFTRFLGTGELETFLAA